MYLIPAIDCPWVHGHGVITQNLEFIDDSSLMRRINLNYDLHNLKRQNGEKEQAIFKSYNEVVYSSSV